MILDIIIVILFIGIMLYGYKKGAIGIIAKLVTVMLSFALAYFFAESVGEYISETSFGMSLQTSITNTINDKLNTSKDSLIVLDVQENLVDNSQNEIYLKIMSYVFRGIGFAIVFVISRIVLWIAQKILEGIFELPVLKTFNKLGGVIASAVLFILELSIVLAIIKAISTLTFMNSVINIIDSSVITKALYTHNIITNLILTKLIK